jgi:hypothetical protein
VEILGLRHETAVLRRWVIHPTRDWADHAVIAVLAHLAKARYQSGLSSRDVLLAWQGR